MSADFYNEMYDPAGALRPHYRAFAEWLASMPAERLARKRAEADTAFHRVGITFAVYGEEAGTERLIPFDIIPRIIPAAEWQALQAGLRQRVKALNAFLHDIYHEQAILKSRLHSAEQVLNNAQFRPEMMGVDVPSGIYAHIAGVDIVRAGAGRVLRPRRQPARPVGRVLHDRGPQDDDAPLSRAVFAAHDRTGAALSRHAARKPAHGRSGKGVSNPTVVLLTPGAYNSAYFEHTFLAQQMGVELVEGRDLFVKDETVFMRTTQGPQRIDVIYRRLDDDFLDPLVFNKDSMLGVPGLLSAYRAGHVTLANAIGTGVADDKSIYPYVPEMIRFYLGEEPKLNNVPTWMLRKPDDLKYVLAHLPELVVKEVHGAGGYGMLVGPASTRAEIEEFRARIIAAPEKYIAQPTLALSNCPTFVESGIAPRHLDLRPFVLSGKRIGMVPGGLTRVALREGSLVVNSSQGGGTKDTWVLEN
jgi:uncharacterized circularly permuted ATP-grasp superfamily protein